MKHLKFKIFPPFHLFHVSRFNPSPHTFFLWGGWKQTRTRIRTTTTTTTTTTKKKNIRPFCLHPKHVVAIKRTLVAVDLFASGKKKKFGFLLVGHVALLEVCVFGRGCPACFFPSSFRNKLI